MFGKLIGYKEISAGAELTFEEGAGWVIFENDSIAHIYSCILEKERASSAVAGIIPAQIEINIKKGRDYIALKTARLLVRVYDDFFVDFLTPDGRMISEQTRRREKGDTVTAEQRLLLEREGHESAAASKEHRIEVARKLYPKECIYGLGDKAGFLDKRGYSYIMWNSDIPATHTDYYPSLYKSIPFFISLRPEFCYGIFFDNTSKSYFDMGKEDSSYYYFGADGGNPDYYFIAGDSMKEVVSGYTLLTGRTPLPQRWTLGYHQSRWGYITSEDIMDVAENMRKNNIPCDSIHLDIDYMDAYKVFTWNMKNYEDPKATIEKLADMGIKPVTIIDPGVKAEKGYYVYDEGIERGYFAFSPEDEIYVNEVWPGEAVYPSFTNPKVRSWWADKQKFLTDMGVRGVWNDMNEPASFKGPLPDDVQFADEDDSVILHKDAHNIYGHCMSQAAFLGWSRHDRGRRPFVITRACYAGTQKYAMVWTGDNQSVWAHLQMAIPQLCNMGLSGFSFAGTDVGGFSADTTKELLARWVQVGCLSPFFRNHSALGTRRQEPWQFDDELTDIYRKYVNLRYRLLPYIYDCFFAGEQTGFPVMRPLVFNFEGDRETVRINDEFMLGDWLLAAPVVTQGSTSRLVYLPAGTDWFDFWTGDKHTGGQYIIRKAPLEVLPLYVRAGAVIPLYPLMQYTDEHEVDTLTLAVYPGKGSYTHYQDDGEGYGYRQGQYNAFEFKQNRGNIKITETVKGYEKRYKGFYIKACKNKETALSDGKGEYLELK